MNYVYDQMETDVRFKHVSPQENLSRFQAFLRHIFKLFQDFEDKKNNTIQVTILLYNLLLLLVIPGHGTLDKLKYNRLLCFDMFLIHTPLTGQRSKHQFNKKNPVFYTLFNV